MCFSSQISLWCLSSSSHLSFPGDGLLICVLFIRSHSSRTDSLPMVWHGVRITRISACTEWHLDKNTIISTSAAHQQHISSTTTVYKRNQTRNILCSTYERLSLFCSSAVIWLCIPSSSLLLVFFLIQIHLFFVWCARVF